MAQAFELENHVAMVTGSSSGVGRAIALEFAAAGADVLIHARTNRAGAEEVAANVRKLGRQAHVLIADLSDTTQQDHLAEAAFAWRGRVDVWVNNAGADVLTGAARNWSFEQKLERLWQVDVVATIRLSRAAGRQMIDYATKKNHPKQIIAASLADGNSPTIETSYDPSLTSSRHNFAILNVGWDQVEQGMGGDSGETFTAIKGAVMAFTKSLSHSLAPHVRVNCLAPGWIRTAWGETASDYWQQRAQRESLLQRWGMPADVARTARFLASPAASFITGQTIPINGGFRHGEPS